MMTRTRIRNSIYTAALALFIAPFALTATAHPEGDEWQKGDRKANREQKREHLQDRIDALDTDADGKISFDEFQAPDRDPFSRFDQNEDGFVTLEEMKEVTAQKTNERLEQRFAKLDADDDGMVTRDEMRHSMFDRMDRDGDGYLTGREFGPRGPGRHRRGRPEFEGS